MCSNRGNTLSTKHTAKTCPNCSNKDSYTIQTTTTTPYTDTISFSLRCKQCGYLWIEHYQLQYNGYDDGYYLYGPNGDAQDVSSHDELQCANMWIK